MALISSQSESLKLNEDLSFQDRHTKLEAHTKQIEKTTTR